MLSPWAGWSCSRSTPRRWRSNTLTGHTDAVYSVAFSPDGRWALSGGKDNTVRLWEVSSSKELKCFKGHADRVWCVAFLPDGRTAASGSFDNTVRLWSIQTGKELRALGRHDGYVSCLAVSPDGRRILAGTDRGFFHLWDVQTGKQLHYLQAVSPLGSLTTVAFLPDGKRALSSSRGLRLWDITAASVKAVPRFQGEVGFVQ